MKLLLTSGGLTNKSIEKALFEMVGKKPEDTTLVFIPTASNVEMGDKSWLINDIININKQNFKSIKIADISSVPESIWRPQLEESDVLFFGGGNMYHLMRWINKSGLTRLMSDLLRNKVYVGLSAGSMVTGPDLPLKFSQVNYEEDLDEAPLEGLNLVNFYFLAHLNSPYFPLLIEEKIKEAGKTLERKIYALDDQSAIKVVDGEVEVISEGNYIEIN